ncbi:hypothetical protein X953_18290 [Virgibacillus sp. SK37]|nr:hypothetical protein X953_18290 [Virgibacillus sp. SK37]
MQRGWQAWREIRIAMGNSVAAEVGLSNKRWLMDNSDRCSGETVQ